MIENLDQLIINGKSNEINRENRENFNFNNRNNECVEKPDIKDEELDLDNNGIENPENNNSFLKEEEEFDYSCYYNNLFSNKEKVDESN